MSVFLNMVANSSEAQSLGVIWFKFAAYSHVEFGIGSSFCPKGFDLDYVIFFPPQNLTLQFPIHSISVG